MHYIEAYLTYEEKAWRQLHKNAEGNIEQVLETAPYEATATYQLLRKLSKLDEPDMLEK